MTINIKSTTGDCDDINVSKVREVTLDLSNMEYKLCLENQVPTECGPLSKGDVITITK